MQKFLASLILMLYKLVNSDILAILLYTAFMFIATAGLNTSIYKSILKSPMIQIEIDEKVGKKFGDDHKLLKDSDIYVRYKFLPYSPVLAKFIYVLLGLLCGFSYKYEEIAAREPMLFGQVPLYKNVFRMFQTSSKQAIMAIICIIASMVLQFVYDSIVSTQMCYDQKSIDKMMFFMTFSANLWIPFAFTVFWFLIHVFLVAYVYYSLTYGKPKLDEALEKEIPPDHPIIVYENQEVYQVDK